MWVGEAQGSVLPNRERNEWVEGMDFWSLVSAHACRRASPARRSCRHSDDVVACLTTYKSNLLEHLTWYREYQPTYNSAMSPANRCMSPVRFFVSAITCYLMTQTSRHKNRMICKIPPRQNNDMLKLLELMYFEYIIGFRRFSWYILMSSMINKWLSTYKFP